MARLSLPPLKEISNTTRKKSALHVAVAEKERFFRLKSPAVAIDKRGLVLQKHPVYSKIIKDLIRKSRFLREAKLDTSLHHLFYTEIPENIDWDDLKQLGNIYPSFPSWFWKLRGERVFPRCLLLEAECPLGKLIIVNWWRGLSRAKQGALTNDMRVYYRAPTRSSSPLQLHPYKMKEAREAKAETQKMKKAWQFRSLTTCQELAEKVNISVEALYCAELDTSNGECVTDGCSYPAILHNRSHCILHRAAWFPLSHHGKLSRGHYLLGLEYVKLGKVKCACSDPICEGIGYT
jgi:hypothetical protein